MTVSKAKTPRSNFPRHPTIGERVMQLEHSHTLLGKSVSETVSKLMELQARQEKLETAYQENAVANAKRDATLSGIEQQLSKWNSNFSRAIWIVATPVLAGTPVFIVALIILVQRQP